MSLEVINQIRIAFQSLKRKISNFYSSEGVIFSYISLTDKKIYLINNPLDLIASTAQNEVIPQFIKKIVLSFGKRLPHLLPHYMFIGSHLLDMIASEVGQTQDQLVKFRWHILAEAAPLREFINKALSEAQDTYNEEFNKIIGKVLDQIMPEGLPGVKENLKALFIELNSILENFIFSVKEKNFIFDITQFDEVKYEIHHGIFVEIENLMLEPECVQGSKTILIADFREKNPFKLEYDYNELSPEMIVAIKEYEQEKCSRIIEKLKNEGVDIIIAIGTVPNSFKDASTFEKILIIETIDEGEYSQLSEYLKCQIYQWNQLDALNSLELIKGLNLEIVRLSKRAFFKLTGDYTSQVNTVINCSNPSEKIQQQKYLNLIINSLKNIKKCQCRVMNIEQVYKALLAHASNTKNKLESYKLCKILKESIMKTLLVNSLKNNKSQGWLDNLETELSWKALFEEVISLMELSTRIEKVIHVKKKEAKDNKNK